MGTPFSVFEMAYMIFEILFGILLRIYLFIFSIIFPIYAMKGLMLGWCYIGLINNYNDNIFKVGRG